MQRPQVSPDAQESAPDAGVVLGTALRRLGRLRAQLRGDWSDGPATLPAWANADGEDVWGDLAWEPPAPEPQQTEHLLPAEPLPLRGRFDLEDDQSPPIAAIEEAAVIAAFAEDRAAHDDAGPVNAPLAGAAEGLLAFLDRLPAEPAPVAFEEPDAVEAYGAIVDVVALLDLPQPGPHARQPRPRANDRPDDVSDIAAFGSCPLPPEAPPDAPPAASMEARVETPAPAAPAEPAPLDPVVVAGAHAGLDLVLQLLDLPEPAPPASPAPPQTEEIAEILAVGAAPLAELLDAVPPEATALILTRPFDPAALIDDALADAFDALLVALNAVAADDVVWDADAAPDAASATPALAACEAALWDIPRHVPCIETFAATPNHETAVRLTRTLRLRAHALEARAFAETTGFGALTANHGDDTLWISALDAEPSQPLDDDASLADWRAPEEEFVSISAPDLAPPRRPALPIVTEEELDALFAHIEDNRQVVLDDLGDETRWSEPYWSDVDSYLAHVSETMDPSLLDPPDPLPSVDMYDLDVRDPDPAPIAATHFWMPGDDGDLVVDGDGEDLFIVGAGDDGATVLVEDGATWTMRTGGAARMDEVVVSLSDDAWSDIDAMSWRRIATLSGVAQLRVEQNARGARRLVVSGALLATDLDEDDVRLVRSGDDGEEDYPVIRPAAAGDWPFADLGTA